MTNKQLKPVRISLRDVFFILFYKLHVFIWTFILIAVLVVGYTLLVKPTYQAGGSVLLKPFFDSSQRLQTQERFDVLPVSEQDINTEINIMTSDALLRRVVEKLHLAKSSGASFLNPLLAGKQEDWPPEALEQVVLQLRSAIDIRPVPVSSIIDVSLKGKDPAQIADIVNTFLNLYIDHHIEVHRPGGGVDFYTQQTEHARQMLLDAEDAMMAFQKDSGVIDIAEQRMNNVHLMRVLRENAALLEADIERVQTILTKVQPFLKADSDLSAVPAELRAQEPLVDLQKSLIPLLVERERITLMYPPAAVEVEDVEKQVKIIEDRIRAQQRQVLRGIELDLAAMVKRRDALRKEIRTVEEESRRLTAYETTRNRLTREVDQRNKNYLLYNDIREDAIIQAQRERSRVANVSVTSWASVPAMPIYPQKLLMTALALMAGLLCGIGAAFAAFFLDHSIKRPEDMERWFQLPVLATIEDMDGPARTAPVPGEMRN